MTRLRLVLAGLALAVLTLVPAGAGAAPAQRIVVLDGDVTEVVFALGFGQQVVAVDTSATYPPAAASRPKIGYQRTLTAEPILAMRPTLILATDSAGPPQVIEQLRATGVTVKILPRSLTLPGVTRKITATAAALGGGAPARATVLVKRVKAQLAEARTLVRKRAAAKRPRVAFLYVRGTQVQMIGGKGTGADALIAAAGGIDAGTAAGLVGFRPITPEALVAARPDVIVTLTAGLQSVGGVDGLLRIPGIAQTPAGKARRILSFDDQKFLGLGPRAGLSLRALVRGLRTDR